MNICHVPHVDMVRLTISVQICIPCSPLREIKGATFSVTFSSFRKLILFHRVRGHNLLNVSYIAVSRRPELEENDYTPVTPQEEHVTVGAIISRQ